ncbi:MAG: transposase family protein [Microcystaceae cyanobacterium]
MKNPLEHLRQYPKTCKQLIGLTLSQLEELIQQAIALDKKQKKEQEMAKVRVNQKGAGRRRSLSPEEGICLTLFYLRQMPIFEVLGMMFGVSKTTANDYFHYWLPILRDLLPSSIIEEWKRLMKDDEFVKELLTSHELLVDSFEQGRERPTDYEVQKKYFSGKRQKHTFKNPVISLPKGNDIVDVVVGERGPEADINLLRKQQKKLSKNQKFKGDKAYISADRTTTPHKKKKNQKLSQAQKEENRKVSQERIYIEHLIRVVKIFRSASERFRLNPDRYQSVILVVLGLIRLRLGTLRFSS